MNVLLNIFIQWNSQDSTLSPACVEKCGVRRIHPEPNSLGNRLIHSGDLVDRPDMTHAPQAVEPETVFRMVGISKRFGVIRALTDVSFEARAGEIHAIVGENGAGKSTLMKVLSGLHQPDSGEIEVAGRPVHMTSTHDSKSSAWRWSTRTSIWCRS